MPINDIVADVDNRPDYSVNDPPEADNVPVDTPEETTMRTGTTQEESRMLPPYLHIQRTPQGDFTLLAMVGTVLLLARYLGKLQ